jgi:hypothetical protein
MKKISYILVPGLWDQRPLFGWSYRAVGKWWRWHGMHTIFCPMKWVTTEPFAQKVKRLETCIQREQKEGREVVLVGASAGAAPAIVAFAKAGSQVWAVVLISGLFTVTDADRQNTLYTKTSWFEGALDAEERVKELSANQRRHMLTLSPWRDNLIHPSREKVSGARNTTVASKAHLPSVVIALVFYWHHIRHFAQNLH